MVKYAAAAAAAASMLPPRARGGARASAFSNLFGVSARRLSIVAFGGYFEGADGHETEIQTIRVTECLFRSIICPVPRHGSGLCFVLTRFTSIPRKQIKFERKRL